MLPDTLTIADLRAQPVREGDNQAPERNAAIDQLEVFVRLGTTSVRIVREEVQQGRANPAVVEQSLAAFRAVEVGIKGIPGKFLGGMAAGLGTVVGKVVGDHCTIRSTRW